MKLVSLTYLKSLYAIRGLLFQETVRKDKIHVAGDVLKLAFLHKFPFLLE